MLAISRQSTIHIVGNFFVSAKRHKRPGLADIVILFMELESESVFFVEGWKFNGREGLSVPNDFGAVSFLLHVYIVILVIYGQLDFRFLAKM